MQINKMILKFKFICYVGYIAVLNLEFRSPLYHGFYKYLCASMLFFMTNYVHDKYVLIFV